MGFSETKFTWERGGVKERLDRALCNAQWRLKYEEDNPTSSQSIDFIHCQGISFKFLFCFPSRQANEQPNEGTKPELAIF